MLEENKKNKKDLEYCFRKVSKKKGGDGTTLRLGHLKTLEKVGRKRKLTTTLNQETLDRIKNQLEDVNSKNAIV